MNSIDYSSFLKSLAKNLIKIFYPALLIFTISVNIYGQSEQLQTENVKSDTSNFVMSKSPWGAVLRSAIIPGLGQFYNESYWKIPVVWGAIGYLGYLWFDSNTNYKKYRDLYLSNNTNLNYLDLRERYRDQRDLNAVFIGLAYFLNLVDAFVDAHLFDFDVSENVDNSLILSVKIKF